MIRRTPIATLLLCGLLAGNSLAAAVHLREVTLEGRLVEDAADGRLDGFDSISAALIAGGVGETDALNEYRNQTLSRCELDCSQLATAENLAAQLFRALHEQLLTGEYHVEYTAPHRAVDEGHFNCVSATILFYCLCEQYGIPAELRATREHVLLKLTGDRTQNVETTCAEWFDRPIDQRIELQSAVSDSRKIDFVQLLGKVFYNRALIELAESKFAEAIRLLNISVQLDMDDAPARENLVAAYNNWALAEAEDGNFQEAVELIAAGLTRDCNYPPLLANDEHLHQAWVIRLCQQNRYPEALELLEAAHARRVDVSLFDLGRLALCQQWAESLFSDHATSEARQVLQLARHRFRGDLRWPAYEAAARQAAARPLGNLTFTQL